jgi:hypothetical protein
LSISVELFFILKYTSGEPWVVGSVKNTLLELLIYFCMPTKSVCLESAREN